jgi:hypothetical protein
MNGKKEENWETVINLVNRLDFFFCYQFESWLLEINGNPIVLWLIGRGFNEANDKRIGVGSNWNHD